MRQGRAAFPLNPNPFGVHVSGCCHLAPGPPDLTLRLRIAPDPAAVEEIERRVAGFGRIWAQDLGRIWQDLGRVEEWRGGLGGALRVEWPFRLPVPEEPTLRRFHSPLIEPDMQICRIRLSDKDSGVRAQGRCGQAPEPQQPQRLVQVAVRVA